MEYKSEGKIDSVNNFISSVKNDIKSWGNRHPFPWFRGQPVDESVIPKLFREQSKKYHINENDLIQDFRMRAQAFGKTPEYGRCDEWLFLMQHSGLPTRLLDWTEGALIALFFAVGELYKTDSFSPVVWMINPLMLNIYSFDGMPILPLSWSSYEYVDDNGNKEKTNCPSNIDAAFISTKYERDLPIALKPQHVHQRVCAQRSCFTVHGRRHEGIYELLKDIILDDNMINVDKFPYHRNYFSNKGLQGKKFVDIYLRKYEIVKEKADEILLDLKMSGISFSTLFPDFDGLSKELSTNKFYEYLEE